MCENISLSVNEAGLCCKQGMNEYFSVVIVSRKQGNRERPVRYLTGHNEWNVWDEKRMKS